MNVDIKTRDDKIRNLHEKYPIFGEIVNINSLVQNILSEKTSDEEANENLNQIENILQNWSKKIKLIDKLADDIAKNFLESKEAKDAIENKK